MGVHDWTKLEAGNFPTFHNAWLTHLGEALNGGLLPDSMYAAVEKHLGVVPDVVAIEVDPPRDAFESNGHATMSDPLGGDLSGGGAAVATAPPASRRTARFEAGAVKEIAVREAAGGRLRALVELVSPANKGSSIAVRKFVGKCQAALRQGVHVAVIDLLPAAGCCPEGLHAEIAGRPEEPPLEGPLLCVGYQAPTDGVFETEAYLDPIGVGDELPGTPLFIGPDRYVALPLAATYARTVDALPKVFKRQIGAA